MPNLITSNMGKVSGKVVTNADVLNTVRAFASPGYQADIPELGHLQQISHANVPYSVYEVHQSEFFDILINRILGTTIKALSWEDPLSMFKTESFDYGETLQEIYVAMAEADDYNARSTRNPFDITDTDIMVFYHDINREKVFRRTIDRAWTQKAFVSDRGFDEFVDKMLVGLLTADQLGEFEAVKQLITTALTPVNIAPKGQPAKMVNTPFEIIDRTQDDWLVTLNKELINRSNLFRIPSTTRFENAAGVPNATPVEDQYFICTSAISSEVDSMLANAFNMSKVEILARKIVVDEFPPYTGAGDANGYTPVCALISKGTIIMRDKLIEMNNLYNPETLGFNYWLHHHQLISYSLLENAKIYVEETPQP